MKHIFKTKSAWTTAQGMLVDARQAYKAYRENRTDWVIELIKGDKSK